MKISRLHSCLFPAALLFLLVPAALASDEENQKRDPGKAQAVASPTTGFLRIMPRLYVYRGDQGYLQRYQTLDPVNENPFDRIMEAANGFALEMRRPEGGAPFLELSHSNAFLLNDRWGFRLRPTEGFRLDLSWGDYQRGFEKLLPPTAPGTITYASRFNDDSRAEDFLRRRRGDFLLDLRMEPAAWYEAVGFLREVRFDFGHLEQRGYRQFHWIFGPAEDLVIPAGNNPSRWRGRTESIDQGTNRYGLETTLVLGKGNITRLRSYGETFSNRAPQITNADIARIDSAVNAQPRTINFIADYRLVGGEFTLEQELTRRITVVLSGLLEELEQKNLAPLQAGAAYQGKIRYGSLGTNLFLDPTDNLGLEIFYRWSRRSNRTPVGLAADPVRAYLLQDRNLSTPFLKTRSEVAFGGSATLYLKGATLRFGARQEKTKRDLVRGIGSNAIPESLTLYGPRSNPTVAWGSLGGRSGKQFRWSARYEYRNAEDTWSVADPGRAHRVRLSTTLNTRSGLAGATVSFSYDDEHNGQFSYRTSTASIPQLHDSQAANLGIQGWYTAANRVQLHAGYQFMDRDQESNLVTTDVRRWRSRLIPTLLEERFGYDSAVHVWSAGATLSFNDRLTLLPSFSWTDSDGGIVSAKTPARDFTLLANENLILGTGADYRLSDRNRLHFRYGYNRYEDDARPALTGNYHGFSFGLTRIF